MKKAGFFLAAAFCIALMSSTASATTYFSQGSVTPTTLTNWNTIRAGGGTSPANFTTAGNAFVIQNTHNMTTSAPWIVSGSGSKLEIESGGTLTAAPTLAVTIGSTATFQVDAGGTYVHQNTNAYGSTIFNGTTSLASASTVILNNSNTTGPSSVIFGNLTVNFTSDPGSSVSLGGGITTINGNLSIVSTSTREFRLAANSPASLTTTIGGDLLISGGTLNLISGTTVLTLNIGGNFNQSGGTFTATGAGPHSVNFTGGSSSVTFAQPGTGTFTNANLNFTIAAGKTVALTNDFPIATARSIMVNGTLNCSTNNISGAGNFTLSSGARLGVGSTDGIDSGTSLGNIRVSGMRTFDPGANYNFTGFSAQVTGNGFPVFVNNFSINSTAGVTLSTDVTVDGVLALTTGDVYTTSSHTLIMGVNAPLSTGSGDVVGAVNRTDLNGAATRNFGNQDVQITINTGTVTAMNVFLAKGVTPNDFSNSVRRVYTITPVSGTNSLATVRLRYIDSELNNNSEATLDLWRKDATFGWQDKSQTMRHDDMSGEQNWVELAGVLQFSDWTLAGNITPTAVDAILLKATRYDKRVLLEWQTGYEVNNVGFNIYREKNGNLERVTPEPVAGSALIAGPGVVLATGFAYSWWDEGIADCGSRIADCRSTRYWIEDIDLTGRTTTHGPFGVELAPPDQMPPPGKGRASLLSALGRDASGAGSTMPVEPKAKIARLTPARMAVQAGLASRTAVKLSVQQEGWYRVEQADLLAAGLPANVDPQILQLFVDGEQLPIVVTSGNLKTSWDGIEFYGIGIDSPSTANHIYWLVAGSQPGTRITPISTKAGSPAPPAFSYPVERRDKVVYFPALKNGGGEKFFGPLVFNAQPTDQSLVLQHVATSGGNATLEVSVQGFTAAPHSVRVLLNGTELGTLQFDGLAKGTAQYSIAQSALKEGGNQVQLISPPGFSDISMSEYVRLTYLHTNDADNNALRFPATFRQQVTIKGFTDSNIRLIDVTTPGSPRELVGTVTNSDGGFSITANVATQGARMLLAFASDQQKKPAAMAANQPSNWRDPSQASDYVVITRKNLIDSLGPLVAHRKSQGLTPSVVDIEDVYDEFSFGNKTPQALKDFISYAKGSWAKAPRFVVLAGDATYDPKNYTGLGDFDLVPTKLVETVFNETATDDWFVDVNADDLADIPVGRLPVRTPEETAALVSKIVGYDATVRTNSVLLFADRNSGFDFEAADTQLRSVIPAKIPVTDIRRGQVGDSDARSQLLNAINQGQRLVNYYGHGSTRLWTDAQTLTAADAANFANRYHLALFVSMTCLNGFFHDPAIESLGESLLKAQGGAIAVWASSGMTDPNSQAVMSQAAIRQLLGPLGTKSTIGETIMRAKGVVSDVDVRRTWILLGDPATRLK